MALLLDVRLILLPFLVVHVPIMLSPTLLTSFTKSTSNTYDHLVTSAHKYKTAADKKCRHVEFYVGDCVWAVLNKDRFPAHEYNKLVARKLWPLEIVEKIKPNAYRLRVPLGYRTSDVFNVKHLVPYVGENSDPFLDDSRTNLSDFAGNDAD